MASNKYLKNMTLEKLKKDHGDLVESIRTEERNKLRTTISAATEQRKLLEANVPAGEATELAGLRAKYSRLLLEKQKLDEQDFLKNSLRDLPLSLQKSLSSELSGLTESEVAEEIKVALSVYHKVNPAEKIGLSEKKESFGEDLSETSRKVKEYLSKPKK